jgi:hypothetical protein
MITAHKVVALGLVGFAVAMTGCSVDLGKTADDIVPGGSSAPSLDDEEENVGTVSQAIAQKSVCPTTAKPYKQRKAAQMLGYVLGGSFNWSNFSDTPRCTEACPAGGGVSIYDSAKCFMDRLKSAISAGKCTVGYARASTVCGIPATKYRLQCTNASVFEMVGPAGFSLDECFGEGVSGFWMTNADYTNNWADIDPEPARLNANLGSTTGASAAATFINTGVATSAFKWPSSYTGGTVAAGTPCATTALSSGTDVMGIIQASGSYRRCVQ